MSIHDFAYSFVSSFIALFPVINPIGSGFIVGGFLEGLDHNQRKAVIKRIVINCLLIGVGSLVLGHFILLLFNLEIPVIQVGGGLLICKTGLEWLSDSGSSSSDVTDETTSKISMKNIESKIFYPLSFPMIMGAGSISVIFTLMATLAAKDNLLKTGINYAMIVLAIIAMCTILFIILSQGQKITKKLSASGNMIINKLIAFFTFCIGIQIIVTGISKIFHLQIL